MSEAPSDGSADSRIELMFELNELDMAGFYRDATEMFPDSKRAWATIRKQYRTSIGLGIALTVAALGAFVVNLRNGGPVDVPPVLAIVLAAGAVGAWWTAAQYRRTLEPTMVARTFREYASMPEARYLLGPQTLSIGRDGLRFACTHHETFQRWSGIAGVTVTTEGVYIRRRDRHCYVIPSRIFETPEGAKAVADRVLEWLDAAGYGERRSTLAFLSENDVPCPKCKYNLRGVTTGMCPECGVELDLGPDPRVVTER